MVFNGVLTDTNNFHRRRQGLEEIVLFLERQATTLASWGTVLGIEEHNLPLPVEVRERKSLTTGGGECEFWGSFSRKFVGHNVPSKFPLKM